MKAYCSSAYFAILNSGTPSGMFRRSRGLRQGDNLSPMLFSLVVEALMRLILKAQSLGLMEDFKVVDDGVRVLVP